VSTGSDPSPDAPTVEAADPGFATLPPVDQFTYPTGTSDVVAQISVDAPAGPEPDPPPPSSGASTSTGDSPDITIRFDVDGRILQHELDLSRIERPPGIRVFLNAATVENRFDLTTPFDPSAWISCAAEQCEIVATQQDPTSRPVLPHEDATDLVAP
jgi:hypothetical protein